MTDAVDLAQKLATEGATGWAAIWSAVAATFAAISSISIMLIQRRNLIESVRPELVLTGWTRRTVGEGEAAHEVISFQTIKNLGRGPALNIHLASFHEVNSRPTAVLSTIRLPILGTNESGALNGEITLWWKNVEADTPGFKYLHITVTIFCLDSRSVRHETRYALFAAEPMEHPMGSELIAPGVALSNRTTTTTTVRWLKLVRCFKRIPFVGRFFGDTT